MTHANNLTAAKAGILLVAGLLIGGLTLASCSRLEPLLQVGAPQDYVDLVEFIDLQVRVYDIEDLQRELDARVSAIETRVGAIDARIPEALVAREVTPEPKPAPAARRAVKRAPAQAPRRPSCPLVSAAMSYVRPGS